MKNLIIAALLLMGFTVKAQHDVSLDVLGFAFSKYGLGYLLSNGSAGVFFNDSSKIALDKSGNTFEYMERKG